MVTLSHHITPRIPATSQGQAAADVEMEVLELRDAGGGFKPWSNKPAVLVTNNCSFRVSDMLWFALMFSQMLWDSTALLTSHFGISRDTNISRPCLSSLQYFLMSLGRHNMTVAMEHHLPVLRWLAGENWARPSEFPKRSCWFETY